VAVHVALLDSTRRTASPDSEPPGITPSSSSRASGSAESSATTADQAPQERVVLEPAARPRNVSHESGAPSPWRTLCRRRD
jgi:hypothetical protein